MQKEDEGSLRSEASGEVVATLDASRLLRDMARRASRIRRSWQHSTSALHRARREYRELVSSMANAAGFTSLSVEPRQIKEAVLRRRADFLKLQAELDDLHAQLEATLRTSDYQIGDIVCWRGDRWFEGRIMHKTAPEDMMLDTEVWDLEVTDPGTMFAGVNMTGRPVHVSEDALVLVRRDKPDPSPEASSAASPLIHSVTLSSDTGVMGEWQAFCHGCEERAKGDMPRVAFWRDQHEADTLVPTLGQEAEK